MATKIFKIFCVGLVGCVVGTSFTSCEDFFDQESDHVVYSNQDHLNNAVDTIYSVTGILKKLQAVADRTHVLGEVRADLVELTSDASADLREVATFNADADNVYNQPSDYYAVINNCNYFIANVDTAMRTNRGEVVFMREYAAVKAIRAWTYLQLAINYGSVPFVVDPILTKEQSERDYPRYDIKAVCDYFINDLKDIPEEYNTRYPGYRSINGYDSRLFWFPLSIVRGELNLWAGHYREAALNYYKYINERNGQNSAYPTGTGYIMWMPGTASWTSMLSSMSTSYGTSYAQNNELITLIPDDSSDSIRSEGFYSELRNLYTSNSENDYKVSLTPSNRIVEISEAQPYCCLNSNGTGVYYAPTDLTQHRTGDLRLSYVWSEGNMVSPLTNERVETQRISKYSSAGGGVRIYRRQMLYLHLAEALNQAGYPRLAYMILTTGLSNKAIQERRIFDCYNTPEDSVFLAQFQFPDNRYAIVDEEDIVLGRLNADHNMLGIHTRGSGWTPMNEYYLLPNDTVDYSWTTTSTDIKPEVSADSREVIEAQMQAVDSLLLNEGALELCFEGTRYYDLMRFAMRQPNPGQFMADHVWARRGTANKDAVRSELGVDLTDQKNWYLKWNGKIGY